ncbi:MAG: hypothetical protein K1X79_08150 [Oligoflexia bacterium]|nr:hypothetical protein [Oligoflexia bacterium]
MNQVNSSSTSYPLINDPNSGGDGRWEKTAQVAGSALDKAEANLLKAFSFTDEKSPGFKSFLKSLGLSAKTSLHGLQMILQLRYDRAKQALSTLSQILFSKNETEQRVIDKIGR